MSNERTPKKPYVTPTVEVIGHVDAITHGPLNGSIDGLVGANGGFAS